MEIFWMASLHIRWLAGFDSRDSICRIRLAYAVAYAVASAVACAVACAVANAAACAVANAAACAISYSTARAVACTAARMAERPHKGGGNEESEGRLRKGAC